MKYMGSKQRISKHIVPILQKYINENNIHFYVEPFCGGCSIIEKIQCKYKMAFDINKYLISLLNHVKEGKSLLEEVPKKLYDEARSEWREGNLGASFLIG